MVFLISTNQVSLRKSVKAEQDMIRGVFTEACSLLGKGFDERWMIKKRGKHFQYGDITIMSCHAVDCFQRRSGGA